MENRYMDNDGASANGVQLRVPMGSRYPVLAFLRAVLVAERASALAGRPHLLE